MRSIGGEVEKTTCLKAVDLRLSPRNSVSTYSIYTRVLFPRKEKYISYKITKNHYFYSNKTRHHLEKFCGRRKNVPHKGVHVLIPRIHEYVTLHVKEDFKRCV